MTIKITMVGEIFKKIRRGEICDNWRVKIARDEEFVAEVDHSMTESEIEKFLDEYGMMPVGRFGLIWDIEASDGRGDVDDQDIDIVLVI